MADETSTPSAAPVADSGATSTESQGSTTDSTQTASGTPVDAQIAANKAASGQKLTKKEQNLIRSFKIKVDGQEYDEQLPFDMPNTPEALEYMRKQAQFAKVSNKRMQEKASIEKEAYQFLQDLQKNPRKVLSDPRLSVDLKKLAQEVIEQEIENSKKSPEQLKAEKLEEEIKSLKEEREREKQTSQQQEFERMKEQAYEQYDIQMSQALEKAELPKSPYYVKKMADYLLLGLQNGMDVSADDILPLVQEEAFEDFRQLLAVLPLDKAEKLIGKDVINTIRKRNVSKAKMASSNPAVKGAARTADTGKKPDAKAKDKTTFKKYFGI